MQFCGACQVQTMIPLAHSLQPSPSTRREIIFGVAVSSGRVLLVRWKRSESRAGQLRRVAESLEQNKLPGSSTLRGPPKNLKALSAGRLGDMGLSIHGQRIRADGELTAMKIIGTPWLKSRYVNSSSLSPVLRHGAEE